ncbi:MAG: hypothetical protein P8127_13650 [Acidobacteriota bacterium]
MNVLWLIGGLLSVLIGLAHSILGEKLVLRPLIKRDNLPVLLGRPDFMRQTLRFTWHLTTVFLASIGVIVMALSSAESGTQSAWLMRIFAITFAACSLLSLVGARARHFSWWVFLTIAVLLWFGA